MKQTSSYVLFLTLTHFNMTHCLNSIMTWLLPMSTLFLVIKMDVNGMFCCSLYIFIKLVLVSVQAMSNMTQIWGSFTCLLSLSLSPSQKERSHHSRRPWGFSQDLEVETEILPVLCIVYGRRQAPYWDITVYTCPCVDCTQLYFIIWIWHTSMQKKCVHVIYYPGKSSNRIKCTHVQCNVGLGFGRLRFWPRGYGTEVGLLLVLAPLLFSFYYFRV